MTVPAQERDRWSWERPDVVQERLRVLRETFRFSPVTAAKAAGVSDQTWRNWESGTTQVGDAQLLAIAFAFESDGNAAARLRDWLRDGGEMPPRPQPPEATVRLSREHDVAGQERFSGSDIDFLVTASLATPAA